MPLYEYHCEKCEHEFEYLLRGQEQPECPQCGSAELKKLISVPSAHRGASSSSLPMAPPGGFCGRGTCGLPGCGDS